MYEQETCEHSSFSCSDFKNAILERTGRKSLFNNRSLDLVNRTNDTLSSIYLMI